MEKITSSQNQWVKRLWQGQRGKGDWGGLCFPEGPKLCMEARKAGLSFTAIFLSEQAAADSRVDWTAQTDRVFVLPESLFKKLSGVKSPQGMIGVCQPPLIGDFPTLKDHFHNYKSTKTPYSLLVLENLQDTGNVGTMIRSAYALGFQGVCLTGFSCNPFQIKILRASMGASFHIPLFIENESGNIARWLKSEGISVIAATLDGQALPQFQRPDKLSLWIGNEGSGISETVKAEADILLTIPMPGGAESFNAAAAAAILMYKMQETILV